MEPDMVLRSESWSERLRFLNTPRISASSVERILSSEPAPEFGLAGLAARQLLEVPIPSRLPVL